jgi:hypothetical protein
MTLLGRKPPSGPGNIYAGQVTFDAASCGAAAVTLQAVPIAEALPGDTVLLTPPPAGLSVAVAACPGYCSVAGTCQVPFVNPTAGALDPASAVYDYVLIRGRQPGP